MPEFGAAGDCMKTVHLNWYYRACEEQTEAGLDGTGVDGDVLRHSINIKKTLERKMNGKSWLRLTTTMVSATSHVHENVPVGDSLLYRIDAVGTDTSFVARLQRGRNDF